MKIELKFLDEINPTELAIHANDINVSQYLRNSFPYPYTLDNALSFINYATQHNDLNFGIVIDDVCVGCISGTFQKDIYIYNCEIGYWLSSLYWNKGITSQVVTAMCHYIFTHYSIHTITAEVFSENEASCHVLGKNGFIKEGYLKDHAYKNGKYYDVILYSLRRPNMQIRHSQDKDVSSIMNFIHQAQSYFKENDIDQWQDGYPDDQRIYDDIALEHSYVLVDDSVIGTMYFAIEDDPCYKVIDGNWLTNDSYAVIHRIVVDQNRKGQNLAFSLLEYAIDKCKYDNIQSIRIDTHKDNLSMQRFLYKNGFELCGVITLESGAPRFAFEKILA